MFFRRDEKTASAKPTPPVFPVPPPVSRPVSPPVPDNPQLVTKLLELDPDGVIRFKIRASKLGKLAELNRNPKIARILAMENRPMSYWEKQRNLFVLAYEAKTGLSVDKGDVGYPGNEVWSSLIPRYWPLPELADGRKPIVTNKFKPGHYGVDLFWKELPSDDPAPGHSTENGRFWYPKGMQALAASDGKVLAAKLGARGHYVILEHANGDTTGYSHGQNVFVQAGDIVKGGTPLFLCGWDLKYSVKPTENNPVHLHFSVKREGDYIDPALWEQYGQYVKI